MGAAGLAAAAAIPPVGAKEAKAPAAEITAEGRTPTKYKLSCAAYSFRKYLDLKKPTMKLEEFISLCADYGIEGTELTEYYFPKPVTAGYVMKLKRHAIRCGLDITGTPMGNSFTLPPGAARDKQIERVKNWIDISADLGSPAIRIFAGNAPKGTEEDQARAWAVDGMKVCLEHAAKRGVVLALENHGGVVATADGLLYFVKELKHDWFGINLDTGNFRTEDPYGDLERCAPHAVTCQVKVEIGPKGKKKEPTDLNRIVAMMRKAEYRGYLTLEYEASEDPKTAVPKHIAALRKAIG
jgi:sugar phosphate isomerase/epimerase